MLAGVLAVLCLTGCSGRMQTTEETELADASGGQQATYEDTALVGNSYIDSFYICLLYTSRLYHYNKKEDAALINTVLFDMGGTLEDIWYNDQTVQTVTGTLLDMLREHGLNAGCTEVALSLIHI